MPLPHKGLDHLAIAVADTEEALTLWRDQLGLPVLFSEKANNDTVLLTHLDLGNTQLQLVQPLVHPHPLWDWLQKNGGPGLHHFCLAVEDMEGSFQELQQQTGLQPASSMHQGTNGKKALFINKNTTAGIQLELTGY
jgi:methylmalonyl-CoA/ethylmalonyl-CoA epimerase